MKSIVSPSKVGILNADMFGAESEPSEHVDWSTPDIMTREEWIELLGSSPEMYASWNPHMIVFEVNPCNAFGIGCGGYVNLETGICSTCGALNNG